LENVGICSMPCVFCDVVDRELMYVQDAVGLQRGLLSLFRALKFGEKAIRSSLRAQLGELSGDASDETGMAGESGERKYPSE
jgi:hypothetical protein